MKIKRIIYWILITTFFLISTSCSISLKDSFRKDNSYNLNKRIYDIEGIGIISHFKGIIQRREMFVLFPDTVNSKLKNELQKNDLVFHIPISIKYFNFMRNWLINNNTYGTKDSSVISLSTSLEGTRYFMDISRRNIALLDSILFDEKVLSKKDKKIIQKYIRPIYKN